MDKHGWLRRFLFGKFMGTMLVILGFVLLACLVGLFVAGVFHA